MLGALLGSLGFTSVRSIKASAETSHSSGKRHFPARKAIYEHFHLLAASDIYGGCDRPLGINLLISTHLPATIFREEIRNALSIPATLNQRDSQYAGQVIALFSSTLLCFSALGLMCNPHLLLSFKTYLELLDMGAYDKAKYSRVEDLGNEDAGPSEEVAKKAPAKRLGKWASDRR